MNHEVFLADIIENPDDDTPRLVYADWLDDQGDEDRGEFIRLQCRLARLPGDDPEEKALETRARELLRRHDRQWTARIAPLVTRGDFHRGFVDRVVLTCKAFLANGDRLWRLAPVRRVQLRDSGTLLESLAASPLLARVRELDLRANFLDDDRLALLAQSPHLRALRSLDLGNNMIQGSGLRTLFQKGNLTSLESLTLDLNHLQPYLSDCLPPKESPSLTTLGVRSNPLGPAGVTGLLRWQGMERLTTFHATFCGVNAVALGEFSRRSLPRLTRLNLGWNIVGEAGLLALAAMPQPRNLQSLDLSHCHLNPRAISNFVRASSWPALTHLDLSSNALDGTCIHELLASSAFPALRDIDLRGTLLTEPDVLNLSRIKGIDQLRQLRLNRTLLNSVLCRQLAETPLHWLARTVENSEQGEAS